MMEALSGWVKEIIFVVMFATFMELLIPESSMQKFVRVIVGLLIMLAIMNPVIEYLNGESAAKEVPALNSLANSQAYYGPSQSNLVTENNRLAKQKFEHDLGTRVTATVKAIDGVKDAKTQVYLKKQDDRPFSGEIEQVAILVNTTSTAGIVQQIKIGATDGNNKMPLTIELENKIKKIVSQLYQVPEERIHVKKWLD